MCVCVLRVMFPNRFCPAKAVLQLAWRPRADARQLAVAADDAALRIYSIHLDGE